MAYIHLNSAAPRTVLPYNGWWCNTKKLRTPGARYAEAAALLGEGRYTDAQMVVQDMPLEKDLRPREVEEHGRMLTYISVLQNAAANQRNAYQLNPTEVTQLEQMVGEHYDRPANWASNLLCAVYDKCRAPYTGGAGAPKSLQYPHHEADATIGDAAITVFPNPASTWTAINYLLPNNREDVAGVIRDVAGREVQLFTLKGEQGQYLLDTRTLAAGTYTMELHTGGAVLATERLVVQP